MKYALFVAEQKSGASGEEATNWSGFASSAKDIPGKHASVATLNEGAYLLRLSDGLHLLSNLVRCAEEWHIQSRTLFFDQEPSWVISEVQKTP